MSGALEDRLTELEVRIVFVEDAMNALSEAVAMQDRQTHEVRDAMQRLRRELVDVRGSLASEGHDPPPPHY